MRIHKICYIMRYMICYIIAGIEQKLNEFPDTIPERVAYSVFSNHKAL